MDHIRNDSIMIKRSSRFIYTIFDKKKNTRAALQFVFFLIKCAFVFRKSYFVGHTFIFFVNLLTIFGFATKKVTPDFSKKS